jgi:NitT/TauT family transport system substrate-binding protein
MKRFHSSPKGIAMSLIRSLSRGLVAAAAATLLLTGCGQSEPPATSASTEPESSAAAQPATEPAAEPAAEPTQLSIAMQPWLGYGAWYIAQEKGFFAENNLEVSLPDFEADAEMVTAFAAGQVQAMNVASHTALRMAEEGVDLKVVLLEDASTSADAIISDGETATITDLKGKEVAYEEGATSDLLLNYALAENGMTIADIKKVPMNAADAGTALVAGKVPVAVTYEPYITAAKDASDKVKVIYEAGAKPGLISDVLAVRADFLSSNPEAVAALVKAWGQAVDYYNSNTDDGRAIIAKGVGESPEDLLTAFDGVQYFGLAENQSQLSGEFLNTTYPAVAEAALAAQLVDGSVKPADVIDITPVNTAAS